MVFPSTESRAHPEEDAIRALAVLQPCGIALPSGVPCPAIVMDAMTHILQPIHCLCFRKKVGSVSHIPA